MKVSFTTAILAVTLSAAVQAAASTWPAACGQDSIQFKVKTDKKQSVSTTLEAGKAVLIFSESVSGSFGSAPTVRFGVDGSWVGANRGASSFAVSISPGEHHLCAVRQSSAISEKVNVGEVTLTAQAGSVYYYDFKITRTAIGSPSERGGGGLPGTTHEMSAKDPETVDSVGFVALDESEGKRRVKNSPLSLFAVKP
jgi:hypothetical protein